jgi:hypothetical protein
MPSGKTILMSDRLYWYSIFTSSHPTVEHPTTTVAISPTYLDLICANRYSKSNDVSLSCLGIMQFLITVFSVEIITDPSFYSSANNNYFSSLTLYARNFAAIPDDGIITS